MQQREEVQVQARASSSSSSSGPTTTMAQQPQNLLLQSAERWSTPPTVRCLLVSSNKMLLGAAAVRSPCLTAKSMLPSMPMGQQRCCVSVIVHWQAAGLRSREAQLSCCADCMVLPVSWGRLRER